MNFNISGIKFEQEVINYINRCGCIKSMNKNMREFMLFIFDNKILATESVRAYKFGENCKADIVIYKGKEKKYISLKTGNNNSVHQEHIESFTNYLCKIGFEKEKILLYKKFHYNDGTIDGSGTDRKDAKDFLKKNKECIRALKLLLNVEENKIKLINRFLFKGEQYLVPEVDYIYYGNIEYGTWASKDEILSYLINTEIITESVTVSNLYLQSLSRNLNFYYSGEFRRNYIQVKWHSIEQDLNNIKIKRQ